MKKVTDMYLLLDIVDYVPGGVRGSYRWSSLGCSHTNGHQQTHPTYIAVHHLIFFVFSSYLSVFHVLNFYKSTLRFKDLVFQD